MIAVAGGGVLDPGVMRKALPANSARNAGAAGLSKINMRNKA